MMTKTYEKWGQEYNLTHPRVRLDEMYDDWTEDREQQYQAGYKQGEVHTIAKWREDREQLQTEIELYSRHRVKLQADNAELRKAARNILHWYDTDNGSLANMNNTAEIFKNMRALLKEPE